MCVLRSWQCQSTWAVVLEERGSEPTWLSSRCCCPSSQRYQYDNVTHTHTTFGCFGFPPFSNIICCEAESLLALLTDLLCFCHQTDLYSGALFVQVCLGWNLYLSTVLMLVVTALYTIAGTHITNSMFFRYSWMLLADTERLDSH